MNAFEISTHGMGGNGVSLGRLCAREIRETARETLSHPLRAVQYLSHLWHGRELTRAFQAAQLALGERMYAAGLDDGQHGKEIAELDRKIAGAEVLRKSAKALKAERAVLLRLLAASALEEDAPLPGADAEYAHARRLQAMLSTQDATLSAIREDLVPRDRTGWGRAAIGIGTIAIFSLFALARVHG